jgi:hypothetical protein
MDSLNTQKITLGNMGQIPDDVTLESPMEQQGDMPPPIDVDDIGEDVEIEVSEDENTEGSEQTPSESNSNLLIFGGLIALLLLFRKKL